MNNQTTPIIYEAYLEYGRNVESREGIKKLEQDFKNSKAISKYYVGMQGRKLVFRFKTNRQRMDFMLGVEKELRNLNNITQRVGW